MTGGEVFLDTNILVYSYDRTDLAKQRQAVETLDALAVAGRGTISTQVLGEFFVSVTRKPAQPLSLEDAWQEVSRHARSWTVFPLTPEVVLEAVRGACEHGLNYRDAQIWAAARLHHVPVVLSEDFQDGRNLDGVQFVNPLEPAFRLVDWI